MATVSASFPASRSTIVTTIAFTSTKVSVVTCAWPESSSAASCPSLGSTASLIVSSPVRPTVYITPRYTGISTSSIGSTTSLIASSAVVCTTSGPSIKPSAIFWTIIPTPMIFCYYFRRRQKILGRGTRSSLCVKSSMKKRK